MLYNVTSMINGIELADFQTGSKIAIDALFGALDVDLDADEIATSGKVEEFDFSTGQISAAQAALVVAVNVTEEFMLGLTFLSKTMEEMEKRGLCECSILFY